MVLLQLKKIFQRSQGRRGKTGAAWQAPSKLDQGAVKRACAGMDQHGKAWVIWEKAGALWSLPQKAGAGRFGARFPMGPGEQPCLAVNGRGKGVALWTHRGDQGYQIKSLALGVANPRGRTLWTAPGPVRHLQVAVDRRGSAVAIWTQEVDGKHEIMAQAYDSRLDAWQVAPVPLGPKMGHPLEPTLALSAQGQGMVLWPVMEEAFEGLVCCHYGSRKKQWSDRPVAVFVGQTGPFRLAMDRRGNACALWTGAGAQAGRTDLMASHYDGIQALWTDPAVLASALRIRSPKLAMHGQDELTAAWCQEEAGGGARLCTKACRDGIWEEKAERMDSGAGPVVAFDLAAAGDDAVLIFLKQSIEGIQMLARWKRRIWGLSMVLGRETPGAEAFSAPLLAASTEGAIATWMQQNGTETTLVSVTTL